MKKKATRITVSFSEHEHAALEAIARREDASLSWVVRRAVSEYLTTRNGPVQEEIPLRLGDPVKS